MSLDIHLHLDSETVTKLLAVAADAEELHFDVNAGTPAPEPDFLDPVGRVILGTLHKELMESKEREAREETSTQYLNQLEKSLGLKRPPKEDPPTGGDPGAPSREIFVQSAERQEWLKKRANLEDGCPSVSAGGPDLKTPLPTPKYEQWPGMGEPEVEPRKEPETVDETAKAFGLDTTTSDPEVLVQTDGVVRHGPGFAHVGGDIGKAKREAANAHNAARNRVVLDEDMKRWLGEFPHEDCPEKGDNDFILDLIETYGAELVGHSIRRVASR